MATAIPKLRTPVVLVHGLFGFDRIRVPGVGWTVKSYFPRIPELLQSGGNRVFIPVLSPTGGVAFRAQQLKDFINRESPQEPVHILAHSMGGLDARYMISKLDMGERVLSLTTLGTPHRGTTFANWGIERFERLAKPVFDLLTIPTQAFYDLTTAGCCQFNEQIPNAASVRYFSVAGRHRDHLRNPSWLLPYAVVYRAEGENDGVVSISSAIWGESIDVWEGDHFSLVNWLNVWGRNRGFWRDPAPRYGPLIQRLKDEGF